MECTDIICPITQCIFKEPVLANDGMTYESDALKTWLKKSKKSPLTRTDITNYYPNVLAKQLIDKYLEANPNKKEDQYEPLPEPFDFDAFIKGNFNIRKKIIDECATFNEPVNSQYPVSTVFRTNNLPIVKYMLSKDNINYNVIRKNGTPVLITLMRNYTLTKELTDLLLDKDIDWNLKSINGWTALHSLIKHQSASVVKFFLPFIENINTETEKGSIFLGIALERNNMSLVNLILSYNPDLTMSHCGHPVIYTAFLKCGLTSLNKILKRIDEWCNDVDFIDLYQSLSKNKYLSNVQKDKILEKLCKYDDELDELF